ncbi:hypothetical protein RB623_00305 [Mesorhizobium sp. LHD-90]|uniref:hypothetical protein n=1 Tax=Mesorhizobium sp. LHD-90 TaxID=3071414 RepID=UPI0027E15726|nr:hypothetical protein [Mesorhizobium sp. LHD-90]MDQ6432490.1 hypothetical protein [Mesorhizobium sp. LHD-90]
MSSPPDIAWELARAWPGSELVLIGEAGHGAGHSSVSDAVIAATDRFAARSGDAAVLWSGVPPPMPMLPGARRVRHETVRGQSIHGA